MDPKIKAARFFDGHRIINDALIELGSDQALRALPPGNNSDQIDYEVEFLSPQFFDWSLHMRGYRRYMSELPYAYLPHFSQLLEFYGTGGGLDIGNTWERIAVARDMINIKQTIAWSGPILVSDKPRHETELFVYTLEAVRNAIEQIARQRAKAVVLGRSFAPELVAIAISEAKKHDLLVAAIPGINSPVQLLKLGADLLIGARNLIFEVIDWTPHTSPFELIKAWAGVSTQEIIERLVDDPKLNFHGVITELVAFRKTLFLQEAVHSSSLELLVPILPDMDRLIEMRSSVGYMVGKRKIQEATGLKILNSAEREEAERGLANLSHVVLAIAGKGRLLPGSSAASLSVCPGLGLLEELSYLQQIGVPTEELLHSVTTRARQLPNLIDNKSQASDVVAISRLQFTGDAASFLNLRGLNVKNVVEANA